MRFFIVVIFVVAVAGAAAAQSPPDNYGDALGWYEREASKGNPRAQFLFGYRHEIGEGTAAMPSSDNDFRMAIAS